MGSAAAIVGYWIASIAALHFCQYWGFIERIRILRHFEMGFYLAGDFKNSFCL